MISLRCGRPGPLARPVVAVLALAGVARFLAMVLVFAGCFVVSPNESRAPVLFDTDRGPERRTGLWGTNPSTSQKRVSLRAPTLDGKTTGTRYG